MLMYLLKSGACLAILLLFYQLFLERESIHVFKRYYLLAALALSFVVPAIVFVEYIEIEPMPEIYPVRAQVTQTPEIVPIDPVTDHDMLNLPRILGWIYVFGVLLFGYKFYRNLLMIVQRIRKNPKYKVNAITKVLLKERIAPHTFFSYIFLNREKFTSNQIPLAVMLHEEAHAKQKHSLDVLIIEVLQVIFWFNPLIFLFKKAIKLNHEFLADQAVVTHGVATATYQHILLAFSSNALAPQFSNSIHYSSIKKRFTVMKTKTSRKSVVLRSILLLPLFSLLLYGFSETRKVIRNINYDKVEVRSNEQETNNTKAKLQDSSKISKEEYYKNVVFKFRDKNNKVVVSKHYDELSLEEQEKLERPLSKISANNPSQAQLHDWHDENKFGVWLDGKRIANNELTAYDPKDIEMYFVSKLAKNAKNYGKHYFQVNLYSKKGFDESFPLEIKPLEKGVVIFLSVDTIESYQKSSSETVQILISKNGQLLLQDNQVVALKDLKTQLLKLNTHLSKKEREQIVKAKIAPAKEAPKSIVDEVVKITKEYGVAMINIDGQVGPPPPDQDGASREEMAEYNKLAKYYNAMPKNKMKILKKDVGRLEYIYALMSYTQKTASEPFPDFPEPPSPPKAPKEPKEVVAPNMMKGEKSNIPPPPPPFAPPKDRKNHSEELLIAFDEFQKEGEAYFEAVSAFTESGEGTTDELHKMYEEVMVLYDDYVELAAKEGLMTPRPRTAPQAKKVEALKEAQEKLRQVEEGKQMEREKKMVEQEAKRREQEIAIEQEEIKLEKQEMLLQVEKEKLQEREIKLQEMKEKLQVPTPPLPPEPVSPLDHIIEMAKKEAAFYYEGKEITSDKAIELLQNNDALNIDSRVSNTKRPIVKISKEPIVIKN